MRQNSERICDRIQRTNSGWFLEQRAHAELNRRIESSWLALTSVGGRAGAADPDARILVEFLDYECPACRAMYGGISDLLADHSDLAIVYRHLPLSIHPSAESAARASICAQEAGRFTAMHSFLMTQHEWQRDADWLRIAKAVGIPTSFPFVECMYATRTARRLELDRRAGEQLGVAGTPTFVGPEGIHPGGLPAEDLVRLLGPS
jgi:protein-disulfide isomerase